MIPVPPAVLAQIASQFSVDPTHLTQLGGGREDSDGITYKFPHLSGERVLKILALSANDPGALARLDERLKLASFLGSRGVRIVYPLEQASGGLLRSVGMGEHLFVGYIMQREPGNHPRPEEWSPEFFHAWGATVGRLHRATQFYPTWQHSFLDGKPILGWREEWEGFYGWLQDEEVKQKWVSIRERLETLPQARDNFGFIHNDPHIENLLYDGREIVLLDFDVANYHWFASDIAIACQAMCFARSGGFERPLSDRPALATFLSDFLKGYTQENPLDPFWIAQIDLFLAYRRTLLFTVLQGWLATVPETRASWKDMILREPVLIGATV